MRRSALGPGRPLGGRSWQSGTRFAGGACESLKRVFNRGGSVSPASPSRRTEHPDLVLLVERPGGDLQGHAEA